MRKINFTIILIILLVNVAFGQKPDPTPTAEETKEAQELAAKFYSRLAETQDVTPLIDEFFVSDFLTRLGFCGKSDDCGGFSRDFWGEEVWQKNNWQRKLKIKKSDLQRYYAFYINYFYLFFRIVNHVNKLKLSDSNNLEKYVSTEIKKQMKHKPELLKYAIYLSGDQEEANFDKSRSVFELRQHLTKAELLISVLKKIETHFLTQIKEKELPQSIYLPQNFGIDIDENKSLFFNYPIGMRLIAVWSNEEDFLFFKMDLVKENGKLKVVVIYPPMD